MDTIETAYSFGLSLHPRMASQALFEDQRTLDPYVETDFSKIIEAFVPITFAINSFNRGMGLADVYPFVIAPAVQEKLAFIHELVFSQNSGRSAMTLQ